MYHLLKHKFTPLIVSVHIVCYSNVTFQEQYVHDCIMNITVKHKQYKPFTINIVSIMKNQEHLSKVCQNTHSLCLDSLQTEV